ncbi:MAG: ATP-binding protein [Elainellaceae cyanobacterium]
MGHHNCSGLIGGLFSCKPLKTQKHAESTGIGLSIVKKIVESEGGNIWLKSEPGSGTVFSFTWPNPKSR